MGPRNKVVYFSQTIIRFYLLSFPPVYFGWGGMGRGEVSIVFCL